MLFYFWFILLFCYSAVVLCALESESNGTLAMVDVVCVCALAYSLRVFTSSVANGFACVVLSV